MEYQKVTYLFDNTNNKLSKLGQKLSLKYSRKTYNTNSQIKFKFSMLKSRLYNCSDRFILVNRTIVTVRKRAD